MLNSLAKLPINIRITNFKQVKKLVFIGNQNDSTFINNRLIVDLVKKMRFPTCSKRLI